MFEQEIKGRRRRVASHYPSMAGPWPGRICYSAGHDDRAMAGLRAAFTQGWPATTPATAPAWPAPRLASCPCSNGCILRPPI